MFELSNIKITNSKVDERSINSNGFWFTPTNDGFYTDGVIGFITRELPSPMWLDRKMFQHLNHLFVTESQTNLFMALCPFVSVNGYSFELKYNRIIGGHQLHVIEVNSDHHHEEEEEEIPLTYSATDQIESVSAAPHGSEEKPADQIEPKSEESTDTEEQVEESQEESTTSRKPKKK